MLIQDLAKKYNVTTDELIALLKNAGHKVAGEKSAVDYEMLTALDRHFAWSNTPTKKAPKTTRKAAAPATEAKPAKKATVTKGAAPKAGAKTAAKPAAKSPAKATASKTAAPAPSADAGSGKTKVKLRKAKAPEPEPTPEVEPIVEKTKPTVAHAQAAPAPVPREVARKVAKVEPKAEEKPKKKSEEAPRPAPAKLPRPKVPSALDELSKGPLDVPLIATEPDTPEEVQEWTLTQEENKHAGHPHHHHPRPSDADQVRESVRRTLAKMETTRKSKRRKSAGPAEPSALPPVRVQEGATPAVLAAALGMRVEEIISRAAGLDVEAQFNTALDRDTIDLIAEELGRRVDVEASYGETQLKIDAKVDPSKLVPRAPVVTIMGHVDHGKTSILDYIRKANVAAGEAGGITQHVGAYEAVTPGGKITFIDTPGHEAFTAMRSRGARITDIVVLVVAADDGVMPQTIEAINHTRAAGVPMIVAINKSDLANANQMAVRQSLAQQSVLLEDFGGDVVGVEVSAKTGKGIDKLLEMILLQAEIGELRADPTSPAQGVVVEVQKEEGRGILVTALIQQGTLRIGDVFVVGNEFGKVRSLFDHAGKAVREAGPSMPVVVLGLDGAPTPGDSLIAVKNEREAREISVKRQEVTRQKELQPVKAMTLEALYEQIQGGATKELNLVIKGDTNGSVEALRDSLAPMAVEVVKINVVHSAVGSVSESDVLLAESTGAIVIAFNTKVTPKAKDVAKLKGVEIRSYKIIYEVIQDVDKAMKGLLEPIFEERILGKAEVRKIFKVGKTGTIAGCMVIDGQIVRNSQARVIRKDEVVFKGRFSSLKRFQDDVREVNTNFECGIGVQGFNDIFEGDIIEAFVVEEKVRVF